MAGSDQRASQFVRALSFGSVAEQYERYRPDYPGELLDVVFQYAARPVQSAVEVGAGTGKATRLFAGHGVHVTALEPDAEMAAVLRRTTAGLPVTTVESTFENYHRTDLVDLVFAAAAWHWTDPATRTTRAFELLSPGGVLALFGSSVDAADPDLRAEVEAIEREVLPEDHDDDLHPWGLGELVDTVGLTDALQLDLPRTVTTSAEDFVGRLSTVSAYLTLSPSSRAEALGRIRSVLPSTVEVDATIQLTLARRV